MFSALLSSRRSFGRRLLQHCDEPCIQGYLRRTIPHVRLVAWRVLLFVINHRERASSNRRAMNTIRCPYCVENGVFKPMSSQGSGEWWVCQRCGHLSLPSKRFFECTCSKCIGMPTGERTLRQNVKIRLQLLHRAVRLLVQQWR